MTRSFRFLASLLLSLPFAPLDAQYLDVLPGTKVRVVAPGVLASRLEGIVTSRTGDSLTIVREGGAPFTVAIARLSSLELSRGKSRGRGAAVGAMWGGGIGLGLGLLAAADEGFVYNCNDSSSSDCVDTDVETVAYTVLGGAGIGAIVGAIVGREQWEKAMLPAHVTVMPVRGGVRVVAQLRW